MKKGLAMLLALTVAAASGCSPIAASYDVGLGVSGGDFYVAGKELTDEMTAGTSGMYFVPVETDGSLTNLRLLKDGELDMATALGMHIDEAYSGGMKNLRLIAPVLPQYLHLVASSASGIRSVSDLKAKRVSLGTEGSGVYAVACLAVEYAELDMKMLQHREMTFSDAAEAIKAGELDAFFVFASTGNAVISELITNGGAVTVPIEQRIAERLAENVGFAVAAIPSGSYDAQDGDVLTVMADAWLVSTESIPKQAAATAAAVAKTYLEKEMEARGIDADSYVPKVMKTPFCERLTD